MFISELMTNILCLVSSEGNIQKKTIVVLLKLYFILFTNIVATFLTMHLYPYGPSFSPRIWMKGKETIYRGKICSEKCVVRSRPDSC